MDIKTRIDALSEQEAKAALAWAIYKARIYGSCFECDLDGKCRKDDSVDCEMEYLRQALKEGGAELSDFNYSEEERFRKYAEAHGCGELRMPKMTDEELKRWRDCIDSERGIRIEPDSPVRPLPCVRDEHGEIREKSRKQLFAKVFEELYEFIERVIGIQETAVVLHEFNSHEKFLIAEEAADTITAITTMLEALGIGVEMRDEAIRRVNAKNKERGRL